MTPLCRSGVFYVGALILAKYLLQIGNVAQQQAVECLEQKLISEKHLLLGAIAGV